MSYDHVFPETAATELKQHYEGGVRQAQIASECLRIGEQTEIIAKMIDDLSVRINPILRPEVNSNMQREIHHTNENEPLAPHADFLRSRNMMLTQAIFQLESLLKRIEL